MPFQEIFQVDQRVIFRQEREISLQWFEGRVLRVMDEGRSYLVQEYGQLCQSFEGVSTEEPSAKSQPPGESVGDSFVVTSGENNIRVLPKERSMLDRMFEAYVKPPIFEDPFAHLYMKMGIKYPTKEEICGIIQEENVRDMFKTVSNRRKIVDGAVPFHNDIPKMLKSILPKERDLIRLEEMAKTDSSAMLQLADVYRFGLLGTTKDENKAVKLYVCAAIGYSCVEEWEDNGYVEEFAYPIGVSEALCAAAQHLWLVEHGFDFDYQERAFDKVVVNLKKSYTDTNELPELLRTTISFLAHAIRRDWKCPFALALANSLIKKQFVHEFFPDGGLLSHAYFCENARTSDENGLKVGGKMDEGFSAASQYQLQQFKSKATKIFLDLPSKSMNPAGTCPSDLHVEYREMAFPPYPIVVMVINPQSNYNFGQIQIPEEFEYTPFSKEAFEHIWGSMVFNSMHRGDFRQGKRYRPTKITFADKPGDRLFAAYVKNAIGGDKCGTQIRIVNTRTHTVKCSFTGTTTLHALQERLESKLVGAMKGMMNGNIHEFRTPIEQAASRFNNRTEMPVEELISRVKDLKQEGNEYFGRGRMQPANRCYTEGIDLIQLNANLNDRAYALLATLLSNRAACFLKMSEGMSPDSAKTALKNCLADCENVLNNRFCANLITENMKKNIEKRKQIASEGITRFVSQTSGLLSEYHTTAFLEEQGSHPRQTEQQQQQPQRQRQQRKKNSKRRNKKKQRRRQQQQRRDEQERLQQSQDNSNDEKVDDFEEVENGLMSVLMGNALLECKITPFVNGREDTCPCCFDRFRVELSDTFCAVNSCGHAYCLPCLSALRKKSNRGSDPLPFNCPVCRIPIEDDVLSSAVNPVVMGSQSLQDRIHSLPLREQEGKQVVHELLLRNDFLVPNVLSALDAMLMDGLQASLRNSKDLSPSEKQKIYEDARKPVDILWSEARELRFKMNTARDLESDQYKKMKKRLNELQTTQIPSATKIAVSYIWERMNTVGKMGAEDEYGEIEIDFHALYVNEAKERFDEQVLPILPAVASVLLVVGRGSHSEGGVAKLKQALKKHIDGHSKLRYSWVEGNDGVMRVRWID